jgi:hypothetical protein
VRSDESWVEIRGQRYRKIEFNGGTYYLQFKIGDTQMADVYCQPPVGHESENLVDSEVQSFKRSGGFVQAFHESCSKDMGAKKTVLRLNPAVGLALPGTVGRGRIGDEGGNGSGGGKRKRVNIPTH